MSEKHYLVIHNSKMPDHVDKVGNKGRAWDNHTIVSLGEAAQDIPVNWRNPFVDDGNGGTTGEFKGQGLKDKVSQRMNAPVNVLELTRSEILECLPVSVEP